VAGSLTTFEEEDGEAADAAEAVTPTTSLLSVHFPGVIPFFNLVVPFSLSMWSCKNLFVYMLYYHVMWQQINEEEAKKLTQKAINSHLDS
jgi:hypothetical protein